MQKWDYLILRYFFTDDRDLSKWGYARRLAKKESEKLGVENTRELRGFLEEGWFWQDMLNDNAVGLNDMELERWYAETKKRKKDVSMTEEERIREKGKDGWDCVSVVPYERGVGDGSSGTVGYQYVFKRPINS